MSRGLGRLQNALFFTIRQHGKPMTFKDIRVVIRKEFEEDGKLYSSFEWSLLYSSLERSLRRALHRMVKDGLLVAFGDGGQSDPYRYFFHPMGIAIMCGEPEAHALWKALEADPGSNEALGKLMAKDRAAKDHAVALRTVMPG
jgi:hypothetical protein